MNTPAADLFLRPTSWPQTIKRSWVRRKIHSAIRDGGWNQPFLGNQVLAPVRQIRGYSPDVLASLYDFETRAIVERFLSNGDSAVLSSQFVPDWVKAAKANILDSEIEDRFSVTRPIAAPASSDPSFVVVIPFFRHLRFLSGCMRSVARAAAGHRCEVVIVNDDPSITRDRVESEIPNSLISVTRVIQPPHNLGITGALNAGITASTGEWILFLDCDDEIEPNALPVMTTYILQHPQIRYISSCMIDIDDDGRLLRYRRRTNAPSRLISYGMNVGHLKAIRRDAFTEYGLLEPAFNGCQDYEFAMRLALFEPILSIPEYLYRYRWHYQTQSVSSAARQDRTTASVLDFIRSVIWAGKQRVPSVWLEKIQGHFGIKQANLHALIRS